MRGTHQARQQAVEPGLGAVLADKVEHQATLLARRQTPATADLLLEQHRALRGRNSNSVSTIGMSMPSL